MMTALWLSLAVAAAPPRVALMTASRVGVAEKDAAQLEARLSRALGEAGLQVLAVSLPCNGVYSCLQEQGRALDVEAVVSITLASGPRQVAVDVETVSVRSGGVLDQHSIGWKNKQPVTTIASMLEDCARAIATRVLAERPVEDAPKVVVLTPPPPVVATPLVIAPPPPPVSRAPELVTGGLAVAAGIAAAVLTGLAAGQQQQLDRAAPYSLTLAQATAQRDAANGLYTAGAVTGGAAAALALTSLTLFLVR